jgi:hypothetical protein
MAKSSKKSEMANACSQANPWHFVSYMIKGPQWYEMGSPQSNRNARKKDKDQSAQNTMEARIMRR